MRQNLSHLLFYIFLLFGLGVYGQQEYKFDYYTLYDYKKHQNDSIIISQEITYSNSQNPWYNLFIIIKKDTIYRAEIRDYLNEKILICKDKEHTNNLNEASLFKTANSYNYDLNYCKRRSKSYYQIAYNVENKKNIINIKRYKNKRKKRLTNESFFITMPSEISKSQHYNFPPLASPLWCKKFKLDNNEIITHSYFIKNEDEKIHVRQLRKIEKIDFTLTINQ